MNALPAVKRYNVAAIKPRSFKFELWNWLNERAYQPCVADQFVLATDYDAQADEVRRLREAMDGEPLPSSQIELMREKAFVQGAAYALATLNRNHDEPTMVAEVLIALGVTTAVELGRHGVDRYDIDGLRDALKYMRRRGIATKRQRAALGSQP